MNLPDLLNKLDKIACKEEDKDMYEQEVAKIKGSFKLVHTGAIMIVWQNKEYFIIRYSNTQILYKQKLLKQAKLAL